MDRLFAGPLGRSAVALDQRPTCGGGFSGQPVSHLRRSIFGGQVIYRGDVVVRVSVDDVGDGTIDIYVSTSRRNGTYTLAADEVPHSGNGDGFVGTSSITFSAVAGSDVYIDIRQGNQSLDHGEAFLNVST